MAANELNRMDSLQFEHVQSQPDVETDRLFRAAGRSGSGTQKDRLPRCSLVMCASVLLSCSTT